MLPEETKQQDLTPPPTVDPVEALRILQETQRKTADLLAQTKTTSPKGPRPVSKMGLGFTQQQSKQKMPAPGVYYSSKYAGDTKELLQSMIDDHNKKDLVINCGALGLAPRTVVNRLHQTWQYLMEHDEQADVWILMRQNVVIKMAGVMVYLMWKSSTMLKVSLLSAAKPLAENARDIDPDFYKTTEERRNAAAQSSIPEELRNASPEELLKQQVVRNGGLDDGIVLEDDEASLTAKSPLSSEDQVVERDSTAQKVSTKSWRDRLNAFVMASAQQKKGEILEFNTLTLTPDDIAHIQSLVLTPYSKYALHYCNDTGFKISLNPELAEAIRKELATEFGAPEAPDQTTEL